MKRITIITIAVCVILLSSINFLNGADARSNPVTATYCDGSALDIYPYSFVTRGDGTTFNCYEVSVTPITDGLRYGFEDKDDGDYDDIVIELWISGNGTANPTAHVKFVSKEASYLHWIHAVYGGTDSLVFKAEDASPGAVFDIALPTRQCPDFEIEAKPAAQRIARGETASYTVTLTGLNGFNSPVNLSVTGLPGGAAGSFSVSPVTPAPTGESILNISTSATTPTGIYNVTVTGAGGGKEHSTTVNLKVTGFAGTISKTFSVKEAKPGDELYINIRAENSTSYTYDKITIRDPLSSLLEYIEDDAGVTPKRSGQEYTWQFPRLKKGRPISFKMKVRVSEKAKQGAITNTAYLSHDSLGKGNAIASNTASLTINVIDVSIRKQVDRTTALPGENLRYTITVKNDSAIDLTQIELSDEISDRLEFISAAPVSSFDFSRSNRGLTWKGDLEAGKQVDVVFTVKVSPDCPSGARIRNVAQIEAKDLEAPIISNTVVTTIQAQPVSLTKVRFTQRPEVPQSEVGRIVRFSITLSNLSPANLVSPVIEDVLPQGFNYVAGTTLVNNLRFDEPRGQRRLLWQLPLIKGGETLILRFQTVIGADAKRGRNILRALLRAKDNTGQDINLEAPAFVNVSTSGFIFYSGVDGTVYIDRDDDDFYSMADTALEGIEVRLSTGEKSITDTMGRYTFESLFPGEYAVGVNTATLPDKYRLSSPYPRVVVLADGLKDSADFAVKFKGDDDVKNARLEGRVFFDKNKNGVFDGGDSLCETFKAKLDDRLMTTGKNGTFVFTPLEPGGHGIEIIYSEGTKTVKKEMTINTGKNHIDIPLEFSGITIIIKGDEQ